MSARKPVIPGNPTSDLVAAWRVKRLRSAGFPDDVALGTARDNTFDLHVLLELIDRGCPAELALRILAPIDSTSHRAELALRDAAR
jgi:hypothetical protein